MFASKFMRFRHNLIEKSNTEVHTVNIAENTKGLPPRLEISTEIIQDS